MQIPCLSSKFESASCMCTDLQRKASPADRSESARALKGHIKVGTNRCSGNFGVAAVQLEQVPITGQRLQSCTQVLLEICSNYTCISA